MSKVGRFNDLMLSVRDSIKQYLIKSLTPESAFLKLVMNYMKPKTTSNHSFTEVCESQWDFWKYYRQLDSAVYKYGYPSPEAISALNAFRAFSTFPHIEVTNDVWNENAISIHRHMKSSLADAVANIESTGRNLSSEEIEYLRLLLTHASGWSSTYPEQMNAHWASFFKISYPHLEGLVVILDTITYPEEFESIPNGWTPEQADFFFSQLLKHIMFMIVHALQLTVDMA